LSKLWIACFLAVFVWSVIHPRDALTWFLDVVPVLGAIVVLALTRRAFPLTPLAYWLLLLLCVVILIGAHYSFDRVPLFNWLRDYTGGHRNDFDKFAHFFQGFVPAIVIREFLIQLGIVSSRFWVMPIAVGLTLAVSATYELVEWQAAVWMGDAANAFIAAQGDPWDAQSDMGMALVGAIVSLALLGRIHDRQLRTLQYWTSINPYSEN